MRLISVLPRRRTDLWAWRARNRMRSRAVLEVLVDVVPKGLLKNAQLFRHWFGVLGYRRVTDDVRAGRLGGCVGLRQSDSDVDGCARGGMRDPPCRPRINALLPPLWLALATSSEWLGRAMLWTLIDAEVHLHIPVLGLWRSAGSRSPRSWSLLTGRPRRASFGSCVRPSRRRRRT